jgi:catechol 2,3-dioxygenase-like lactoylglutathione lyase family enzyme
VELEALDHVGLVVSDVSRSVRWYQEVLGLRRAHEDVWGDFPAVLEPTAAAWPCSPTRTAGPSP